jgi:hypothetical protein
MTEDRALWMAAGVVAAACGAIIASMLVGCGPGSQPADEEEARAGGGHGRSP